MSTPAGAHALRARRPGHALSAAAAVWSFAFVCFFGTHVTTFEPDLRLIAAVLYGLPVLVSAVAALIWRPHPLDLPVLGLLATYALVSALSADATASFETLLLVSAYAGLFLAMLRLDDGPLKQGLVIGCAAAGSAWLGIIALRWIGEAVEWVRLDGSMPPLQARSGNPWLSTDAVAALALLVLPYHLRVSWRALRLVLLGVAIAGAVVVIPMSGGRVEWGAMVVAALFFFVASRPRRARAVRAVVLALGVAAAAAAALFVAGYLGTLSGRTFIWQTALTVIGNHPLDGAGPGAFPWVRLAESPQLVNRYAVYHAHNLVLQVLADGGVLLAAALVAATAAYVWHLVRGRVPLTSIQVATLATLIGFVLVLMLDELTQLPALTALFVGSAALVAHGRPPAGRRTAKGILRGAPAATGLVVLVLISLPAAIDTQSSRVAGLLGRQLGVDEAWQGARGAYATAADEWPSHASYQLALGLAEAHLGNEESAREHYARARELSPGDPRPLGALGALDPSASARIEALRAASRLGALDPQYGYRLATELLAAGDRTQAMEEMGRAVLLDPQLLVAGDPAGRGFDLDGLESSLRRALAAEGPLIGTDREAVEAAIDFALGATPEGNPTMAALAQARDGDLEGARARLAEILRADPLDRAARMAARQTSRLACDTAEERRHDLLLNLLPGGQALLYFPDSQVRDSRDHVYAESGLGDYQPPQAADLPIYLHEWPAGFLPAPDCEPGT